MFKKWTYAKLFSLLVFILLCSNSISCVKAWEIDLTSKVTNVVDGDSFKIQGDEVRLADVDAPEFYEEGYSKASERLDHYINGRKAFLDLDQKTGRDPYGRLIAVVYIEINSTHFLNVNEALIQDGTVIEIDYPDNEFNPDDWERLVENPLAQKPAPSVEPIPELEEGNYTLNIIVEGSGMTSPGNSSHSYLEDTNVEIRAVPSEGWQFNHCIIDNDASEISLPITIRMDENHEITIIFTRETQNSQIKFNIMDEEGKPIQGAKIQSTSQPKNQGPIIIEADENGSAFTNRVYPGDYSFTISKRGYGTVTKHITLAQDESKNLSWILNEIPVDIEITLEDNHGLPASNLVLGSFTQPFNQIPLNGETDENGIIIFRGVKPGVYSFQVSGRWIRDKTMSFDVHLVDEGSHEFRETVRRTSALTLYFEVETEDFASVDNVTIEILESPDGQEDIKLTVNSGDMISALLPGNYVFRVSKQGYEIIQASCSTVEGESQPEFIIMNQTEHTAVIGRNSLLLLTFTCIPILALIQKRMKETQPITPETPEIVIEPEPEESKTPIEVAEQVIQIPETPRYWGTSMGSLIEVIVLYELHNVDEMKAVLDMDEKEFHNNFHDLLESGELERQKNGFFVRQDLRDEWLRYYH